MSGETILIIEDNEINLRLEKAVLKNQGYNLLTALDAEQALLILKNNKPHLILMDLQLPGINGLQLTKILKENHQTKNIPIIALTAYAMKGDKELAEAAGCNGYISKPIDTRQFPKDISNFLLQLSETTLK
jgi:two-component system cell cycle response regulator DivK